MRIFIYSTGQDTNGNGKRIKEGFSRVAPEHQIDVLAMRQSWIAYPEDHGGDLRHRQAAAERLYDAADVVHLFNSLDGWQDLDQRDGVRRRKPIVLHHHGTTFRDRPHETAEGGRRVNARQLVSTLDLAVLEDDQTWLPAIYNLDELAAIREREYQPGEKLRVVHAPTNRAVKNTDEIVAALEGLPIEFDLIWRAPWHECLARIARADVVIDQLTIGTGSLAVEAWGMGIPVVAGVADPRVRAEMLARWGRLPFIDATAKTLRTTVRKLASADARAEWAERGNAHARRYHDERVIVPQLVDIYGAAEPSRYPVSTWRGVKPWRNG